MSSSFLGMPARARRVLAPVAVVLALLPSGATRADNAPQTLPLSQNWSNPGLITINDTWSAVPGITGYRGDDLTTATGTDPRNILTDGTTTPVNVIANQTAPNTLATGGVAEFEATASNPNPTIALNGSGTADAPFILISVSTLGRTGITVAYNVRDMDGSADNSTQQVALHYRVGSSGNFTNVPAGYVADATTQNSASQVTPISVVLPANADNQPLVQLRMMTTNAAGNDEWVGIDDISVTGTVIPTNNPSGTGSASPPSVAQGQASLLTVSVTPGTDPTSTGIQVSADLSSIGGSATQPFADNGGNSFSFTATVAAGTSVGPKTLPVTISDAQGRVGGASLTVTVYEPVGHPVISQIYGGGGNASATYRNDYVELYNPGTDPVEITGWTVQYASAGGIFSVLGSQPLAGVIGPGEYYLVSLASGGSTGADLPPANVYGDNINLSATTGKVVLASNGDPVSTATCPLTDPDVVDFVGYGTANCREGAANAPTPSATVALLRKNGGAIDTNQNGSDFVTGPPNPRRTAPIVEVGPRVQTKDPRSNEMDAPRDASVTITFSEAVDVTDGWFDVSCATTGSHNDATVAGGPRTFVITPNVNFVPTESCSVTIHKDLVHDQDLDDATPDTDTLPADYSWTFFIATGAAPPYPPDVHLTMGNPSEATADLATPNNYLMEKPEFALSYNRDRGTPNWVSWHLDNSWVGELPRNDTFRPDPAVPSDWYRVQADYGAAGFDRGHMTPNADRDNLNSIPINQATFLMTNMVPQAPGNNQGPWADLESYLRTLLPDNEIYIVSGPAGTGGTGTNGFAETLANGHVTVPAKTWKVALVLPLPKADNDVSRVRASTRTIAVIMPNQDNIRNDDWHIYLRTVDQVEAETGYDFFANVEDAVENSIEAGLNGDNPPGAANQSLTAREDAPEDFVLNAKSPSDGPLTYSIVSSPTHGALSPGAGAARTYTPYPNFEGTDTFTFQASEGDRTSNTATVTIKILEVNDPPIATDDARGTNEDTALAFPAPDLTANDTAGPANENGQMLTVSAVSATADTHGTVALSGGQVTYVPDANFNGPATFSYQVCDNGTSERELDPKCSTGTVSVQVAPLNDAPTLAVGTSHTVTLGRTLTFVAEGADADIPAQALRYGLSGAVPAGASINPATGVFTWTPTAAQSGSSYAFNVTVTDGVATTSVAIAVSVIGPLGIERDVRDRIQLLRNTVHDRSDGKSLDDVIEDLTDAVQSRYWIDESHLDPRKGDKVFDENEQAVRELAKLKRECHSRIPDAVLQGFIDDLVRAMRLLAETAIGDAIVAHGDGKDIAKAQVDFADGNRDATHGRPDDAIEDYGRAWERALKAVR